MLGVYRGGFYFFWGGLFASLLSGCAGEFRPYGALSGREVTTSRKDDVASRQVREVGGRSVWRQRTVASIPPERIGHAHSSRRSAGGYYKIGKPYEVNGTWYYPRSNPHYDEVGMASWYGRDGAITANGEQYGSSKLTAAHTTLPLPSYVYVTNLANSRTILVRVNDRGPFIAGRIVDLSRAAAEAIGVHSTGVARVRVRYAGPAPLDGSDVREKNYLAGQQWNTFALR